MLLAVQYWKNRVTLRLIIFITRDSDDNGHKHVEVDVLQRRVLAVIKMRTQILLKNSYQKPKFFSE